MAPFLVIPAGRGRLSLAAARQTTSHLRQLVRHAAIRGVQCCHFVYLTRRDRAGGASSESFCGSGKVVCVRVKRTVTVGPEDC